MKKLINKGVDLKYETYSVHSVTNILKLFIRSLPHALISVDVVDGSTEVRPITYTYYSVVYGVAGPEYTPLGAINKNPRSALVFKGFRALFASAPVLVISPPRHH